MENERKNLHYPFIFIRIHSFIYLISYAIGITNFYVILSSEYKSFFISSFIILGLVFIFMVKLVCLFKSSYDSNDSIKCSLIIYTIMSIISLIFIVVEYYLIFKNINDPKCLLEKPYKIVYLCISLLYHVYNNLIFIYECYIVIKAVDKNISERIQSQNLQQGNNNINNEKLETQSSEKAKKDISFVKEDTIVIVKGKFKDEQENQNENMVNIKNVSNIKNSSNTSRIFKDENNDEIEFKINNIENEKNMENNNNIYINKIIVRKIVPDNKKSNKKTNFDDEEL